MTKIFDTPVVPISWGELIDKITILEIKKLKIKSVTALGNINKELDYLNRIVVNNLGVMESISSLKNELYSVNIKLWKVEDDIRDKEFKREFDSLFIKLARSVYRLNDRRAKIKNLVNQALKSELMEEKSYKDFNGPNSLQG